MLTILLKTVRTIICLFFAAVFFSQTSFPADSSLYSLERGLNELIFNLSRSVVTVESSRFITVPASRNSAGAFTQRLVSSGIICDTSGYILVAAPMVAEQEKITVNLCHHLYPARIVGIDYYNDLALLQIQPGIGKPVNFSDNYACAGQMIIAIGNSYGLQTSPSMGFCAGLREDGNIQTTVPVGSGCIGGGMFDLSGNLLGIIAGQVEPDSKMALAVPSYKIPPIIEYLKKYGDRHAGFIGIATAEIEIFPQVEVQENTAIFGTDKGRRVITSGIIINSVLPSSPADRAGLRRGDLVLSFNNHLVSSSAFLVDEVRKCHPGQVVNMEILRQNTLYKVQLQVSQKKIPQSDNSSLYESNFPVNYRTADSLANVLKSLKEEISQMEERLNQLK